MLMPSVERYMTREPHSIDSTASLHHARTQLQEHNIRHLPVVDGDQLIGMISERDIEMVHAVPGVNLACVEVARVMTTPLYVSISTPLDEVSRLMAARRSDCVVVRGSHGVEGIFTATDALDALADLLRRATA